MEPHAIIACSVTALAVALWAVLAFNGLVRARNLTREAWSGIDVQLKRRHNLIPRLVELVRKYATHEREVLTTVTRLRGESRAAAEVKAMELSENALSQSLRTLIARVEAYPDLKADKVYLDLQKQLVEVEDQIQFARRYYNGTVRDYNIRVESFPNNLMARVCGFRISQFFELESALQARAPEVEV